MGNRGPKPTPTPLLRLRGSRRGNANPNEPSFLGYVDQPPPPDWLLEDAKTEWARVVPALLRCCVLRPVDEQILAAYCQSYARWREADLWLTENGSTVVLRDKDGLVKYVQQVPQVAIARAERAAMMKAAAEFGLTPAARSRVQADETNEKPTDPLEALLERKQRG